MRQSQGLFGQQLLERRMNALFQIIDEGIEQVSGAIQEAATREPCKVLAFKNRMSDEGVRKVRDGDRKRHSLPSLMHWFANDPAARAVMRRYLDRFDEPTFWDLDTQRDFHRDLGHAWRRT